MRRLFVSNNINDHIGMATGEQGDDIPCLNTDRELWREPRRDEPSDFYCNSIHVTEKGGIGIDVGGRVFVKTLAEWHRLAEQISQQREKIAALMIKHGFATGHGESVNALLGELDWQLTEARQQRAFLAKHANESNDSARRVEKRLNERHATHLRELKTLVAQLNVILTVPAAEYVPAISEAWGVIEATLALLNKLLPAEVGDKGGADGK